MKQPASVIGAQWGDEGKGKIVDFLASNFDTVVRFNGGNNAGHTVIYNGEACKLHILPSGVFHSKKLVITQGAVFDPEVLLEEFALIKKHKLNPKLIIDYRVNLVMPYHKLMDSANEMWKGKGATGSVKAGIGYCYEDRNNRTAIRVEDLLYPKILKEKLTTIFPLKKKILTSVYGVLVPFTVESLYMRLLDIAKILKPYIGDGMSFLAKAQKTDSVLYEGANGVMLDGNFGTYPYTVACNTISSSLFSSVGLPAFPLNTIGIVKAYTTRVGNGYFATEQINASGKTMQTVGKEIGSTSGRIRRCGWLDMPQLRFAHALNNFSELIVTKLDVLSEFNEIPVCIGYTLAGKKIPGYPAVSHEYPNCKPIYKMLKGWEEPIHTIKSFKKLPKAAQVYVEFIEKQLNVPVSYVSVGPERESILKK